MTGSSTRINNRFFKGGNSFRGFDVAGLGPREVQYFFENSTGCALSAIDSCAVKPLFLDVGVAPPSSSIPRLNDDGTQVVTEDGQLVFDTAEKDASGDQRPSFPGCE